MTRAHDRPRTRLDPAVRKRQIVEAAARVFARSDPGDVSFEVIAEEAGVSRSLVYSYFGDRGSLFAAAYRHELRRVEADVDASLDASGTDRERVARAVEAYLGFAQRHRHTWAMLASASSSRHPAVREAVQARTDRIAAAVGATPHARILIRGMIGMLEAAAVHLLETDDADHVALAELLTQVIWDGVSSLVGTAGPGGDGGRPR